MLSIARIRTLVSAVFLGLMVLTGCFEAKATAACNLTTFPPANQLFGLDFSPYENGQDPNLGSQISAAQILARLQIVQPHTKWIRSYSSTNGLENIPSVARSLGLCVAATAWISTDPARNALEIANLTTAVNDGFVDIAIVGSEVILRGDATVNQLEGYMTQVRNAIPSNIPVTTADVWETFVNNPQLIAASDVVFINLFPYWETTSINNAMCSLPKEYAQVTALSGSKTVVVSESGWPSAGNPQGAALPSPDNAALFADQFLTWASTNGVPAFYFDAFDEAWKAATNEGPQGAHWGIWDATGNIKPGMDDFFNGQTALNSCNGTIPGPTAISFTYVPPYGNGASDQLEIQATGIQTAGYIVETYIKVAGSWWTKPTLAQPTVPLNPDGTAKYVIVSGGNDAFATDIAVFLIPVGTAPVVVLGGSLPSIPTAVASFQDSRTPASISGVVTDTKNNPIAGAIVSDPILGSTTTPADGKYSFYKINASGTVNPAAVFPNYYFPPPTPFTIPTGKLFPVNFQGTPTVDLSVESSVSSSVAAVGSTITETIVPSNAGPPGATDAVVTASSPSSFTVLSAVSTRGTCNAAAVPVTCDLGALARSAGATVTLSLTPTVSGTFVLSASVSGPDLDTNTLNNTASQTINVVAPAIVSNVSSTAVNGVYGVGASIGVNVTFSSPVIVTGTPSIALNSGGSALYVGGNGTSTLSFQYTVAAGQNSSRLDYVSNSALRLSGGSIADASSFPAVLTLPAPGTAGSLGAGSAIVIDTVAPQVISWQVLFGSQSFTVTGSTRSRLPWQITGIRVVFSKSVTGGNAASLSGVTATGLAGLGSSTLTWTVNPLVLGSFSTALAGAGLNALTDVAGNALAGGAGFTQTLRVLYGDYNDDGVVNAADQTSVNLARGASYNIFADVNGDGAVNLTDVQIIRTRIGTTLP